MERQRKRKGEKKKEAMNNGLSTDFFKKANFEFEVKIHSYNFEQSISKNLVFLTGNIYMKNIL